MRFGPARPAAMTGRTRRGRPRCPARQCQQHRGSVPAPARWVRSRPGRPVRCSTPSEWRSIGPDRGGRSIAVTGVKGRPREAYFGAVGGGLWKTTDGGENWLPVTDGQIKSASVGAVAVAEPTRPGVHRHGGVLHPRQHHAGRRRLPVGGCRQDLDPRRLRRLAGDLEDPDHRSDHLTSSSSHPFGNITAHPAPNAASSRVSTAARPGRRPSSATTRPARSISRSIRRTPT